MNEIFKKLFAKNNLSEADTAFFAGDFNLIVFTTLVGATKDKLSPDEQAKIQQDWQEGKLDAVFSLIKSKYSDEGWGQAIETHIEPLFSSYLREVVQLGK